MDNGKLKSNAAYARCFDKLTRSDSAIINSQLSIINYLQLQMAAAGNQNVTTREHVRLVAR